MTLRLGISGFAHGHVGMYCGEWRKMSPDVVRVVAGWDHDAARLDAAVKAHGVAPEATAESLLARKDIDAVIIAAETSRHAELTELAAAAGKHIVVQKPLALTLEQADRMADAVRRGGVKFSLAWQMRVDPQNMQMRKLVRERALGRVYMLRRRHCLNMHLWANFENAWHVKPELNRGMWADDASHAIDFVYWMLGKPVTVTAEIDTLWKPNVPDDHGIAIFRYPDGTFAEVSSSFVSAVGENTTEIVAENGVVIQNYGDLVSCGVPRPADAAGLRWYITPEKRWQTGDAPTPPNHGERLRGLAVPILDFFEGRRDPIATLAEGRDVLQMTLACYRSSELGRRVRIDETR